MRTTASLAHKHLLPERAKGSTLLGCAVVQPTCRWRSEFVWPLHYVWLRWMRSGNCSGVNGFGSVMLEVFAPPPARKVHLTPKTGQFNLVPPGADASKRYTGLVDQSVSQERLTRPGISCCTPGGAQPWQNFFHVFWRSFTLFFTHLLQVTRLLL